MVKAGHTGMSSLRKALAFARRWEPENVLIEGKDLTQVFTDACHVGRMDYNRRGGGKESKQGPCATERRLWRN